MQRRVAAGPALALAVLAACTPIGPRSDADDELAAPLPEPEGGDLFAYLPDARPLAIGEAVPDFRLRDASGEPLDLADLRGTVVLLSFVNRTDGSGTSGEVLARMREIDRGMVDELAARTTLVVMLIDDDPSAAELRELATQVPAAGPGWRFVSAGPETTARLTAAFGVVIWRAGDGATESTLTTVVIDPSGRYVDRLPGLDDWSAIDAVAAVATAGGR